MLIGVCSNRMTQEFMTDPLEIRFKHTKGGLLSSWTGGPDKSHSIKVKFVGECGGGPVREIKWVASGDVRDFYQPGSTYVEVLSSDTDEDYCRGKDLGNETSTEAIAQEIMEETGFEPEPEAAKAPVVVLPEWKFEYYLIGGAVQICILIIINNCKEQQQDRILAILSDSLQT